MAWRVAQGKLPAEFLCQAPGVVQEIDRRINRHWTGNARRQGRVAWTTGINSREIGAGNMPSFKRGKMKRYGLYKILGDALRIHNQVGTREIKNTRAGSYRPCYGIDHEGCVPVGQKRSLGRPQHCGEIIKGARCGTGGKWRSGQHHQRSVRLNFESGDLYGPAVSGIKKLGLDRVWSRSWTRRGCRRW